MSSHNAKNQPAQRGHGALMMTTGVVWCVVQVLPEPGAAAKGGWEDADLPGTRDAGMRSTRPSRSVFAWSHENEGLLGEHGGGGWLRGDGGGPRMRR
jgi:hypothetical protein